MDELVFMLRNSLDRALQVDEDLTAFGNTLYKGYHKDSPERHTLRYSLTVEAKLSSECTQQSAASASARVRDDRPSKIIFAASLDTSEPEMFMAIPKSA